MILAPLPIKHKNIICQPMISSVDLERYLSGVELVVVGGESDRFARPMYYDWVLSLRQQCIRQTFPYCPPLVQCPPVIKTLPILISTEYFLLLSYDLIGMTFPILLRI